MSSLLSSSIKLPASGLTVPNRLVKAAMAEGLADKSGDPNDKHIQAYSEWATGEWGIVLTGNVEVSTIYKGGPEAVTAVPTSKSNREAWTRYALAAQQNNTIAVVQLVHPGRQSPMKTGDRGFFDKTIAPSAVPLKIGTGLFERAISSLVFGTPKEMTISDIEEVVQQFAAAAKLSYESGYKGIELHAAHGYLLSIFLDSRTNLRTDAYGGSPAKRAKIIVDTVRAIRKEVPSTFVVGIKLNSADLPGAEALEERLEQIGIIGQEQVDFLEISGGSYENPRMYDGTNLAAGVKESTRKREAFFLDFAQAVRDKYPHIVLMVTGGFRTRKGMVAALESKACDLIGVGRPATVFPHLPKDIFLNENVKDEDAKIVLERTKEPWWVKFIPIKMLGAGLDTFYYTTQIKAMALGKQPKPPQKA